MKYLIADWGIERFKAQVEEYFGESLPEPHSADVTDVDDHMGWHEQGDGRWFLGVNVESGRIKNEGNLRLKTAIREILSRYPVDTRLTALQGFLLCDLEPSARGDVDAILKDHGVASAEELTLSRRYSIACPAFPTCGLAITESERVMPDIMTDIEAELERHGLGNERVDSPHDRMSEWLRASLYAGYRIGRKSSGKVHALSGRQSGRDTDRLHL